MLVKTRCGHIFSFEDTCDYTCPVSMQKDRYGIARHLTGKKIQRKADEKRTVEIQLRILFVNI